MKRLSFTLIELLVVIAITGLLAGFLFVSFTGVQKGARDTERKAHITQYQQGLEIYANARNGLYPVFSGSVSLKDNVCSSLTSLSGCPEDPRRVEDSTFVYNYQSDSGGTQYVLWGKLERSPDFWVICSAGQKGFVSQSTTISGGTCPAVSEVASSGTSPTSAPTSAPTTAPTSAPTSAPTTAPTSPPPTTGGVPTVKTRTASQTTSTSATLEGDVNPNGAATDAWFDYGVKTTDCTASVLTSKTSVVFVGSGTTNSLVTVRQDGLSPATNYCFRIVAKNSFGTANGEIIQFETGLPIPESTAYKRVFVTSTTYHGNLGGVSGANSKCQERANAVGRGGTWKAWISDSTKSPANQSDGDTWTHSTVAYKLLNNLTIASNWADLTGTDETIAFPINVTETGGLVKESGGLGAVVFTSTFPNGNFNDRLFGTATSTDIFTCVNWTSFESGKSGRGGNALYSDFKWTRSEFSSGGSTIDGYTWCNRGDIPHLYCFEQ